MKTLALKFLQLLLGATPMEASWQLLSTFKIHALLDPVVLLLELYPAHIFTQVHTRLQNLHEGIL